MAEEMITIGRRRYRKFIRYPGPVTDGTARCFACGQIDEPEWHDDALCRASQVITDAGRAALEQGQ